MLSFCSICLQEKQSKKGTRVFKKSRKSKEETNLSWKRWTIDRLTMSLVENPGGGKSRYNAQFYQTRYMVANELEKGLQIKKRVIDYLRKASFNFGQNHRSASETLINARKEPQEKNLSDMPSGVDSQGATSCAAEEMQNPLVDERSDEEILAEKYFGERYHLKTAEAWQTNANRECLDEDKLDKLFSANCDDILKSEMKQDHFDFKEAAFEDSNFGGNDSVTVRKCQKSLPMTITIVPHIGTPSSSFEGTTAHQQMNLSTENVNDGSPLKTLDMDEKSRSAFDEEFSQEARAEELKKEKSTSVWEFGTGTILDSSFNFGEGEFVSSTPFKPRQSAAAGESSTSSQKLHSKHSPAVFVSPPENTGCRESSKLSANSERQKSQISIGGLETPVKEPPAEGIKPVKPTEKWDCDPSCDAKLPKNWATRLHSGLKSLDNEKDINTDLMALENNLIGFEYCDQCDPTQYPHCALGSDECKDNLKLMRSVAPHSCGVRTLMRAFYTMRQLNNWLIQLDDILDSGEFAIFMNHIDMEKTFDTIPKRYREEILSAMDFHRQLNEDEIADCQKVQQQFGKLISNFEKKIGPDSWDRDICDICHLWVQHVRRVDNFEQLPTSDEHVRAQLQERLQFQKDIRICDGKKRGSRCCWQELKIRNMLPISAVENGLGIDIVPEEFSDFTPQEEMLVNLAKCFIRVLRLQSYGGKNAASRQIRAMKGNAINLPLPLDADVALVGKTLPSPEFVTVLVDSMPTAQKKIWRSMVRMDKVVKFIHYLKKNNPLYKDITVLDSKDPVLAEKMNAAFRLAREETDEDDDGPADLSSSIIPEEASKSPAPEGAGANDGISMIAPSANDGREGDEAATEPQPAQLRHIDEEEKIQMVEFKECSIHPLEKGQPSGNDAELYQKIRVQGTPLDDKEPDLEMKCFAMSYPKGRNGPNSARTRKVDDRVFVKSRIRNKNPGFRRNHQYIFYRMQQRIRKDMNSGIYATLNVKKNPGMSAKQFADGIRSGKLEGSVANMFSQMPQTKEYWNARRSKYLSSAFRDHPL